MVWDTIHLPGGGAAPREQWGGIAYSLCALAAALPAGWRWVPMVKLGEDLAPAATEYVRALRGVEPGPGLRAVPHPMNRVELRYRDAAERTERLSGGVPTWTAAELAPLLAGVDALYLNFVSGFELDLATARGLRRAVAGPVYADLHSLFLGPPGAGPREPRPLPAWEEWLACFDAVQLNDTELSLLTGGDASPERAARLLAAGPSLLLCTRGAAGVDLHRRVEGGGAGTTRIPPPGGPLDGDPTGCGDVFGAACFAALLGGATPEAAVERGQALAARKISHPGTAALAERLAARTPT